VHPREPSRLVAIPDTRPNDWLIDLEDGSPLSPEAALARNRIAATGTVKFLIDATNYFGALLEEVSAGLTSAPPGDLHIQIAAWRLNDIPLPDALAPTTTLVKLVAKIVAYGGTVRVLHSPHMGGVLSMRTASALRSAGATVRRSTAASAGARSVHDKFVVVQRVSSASTAFVGIDPSTTRVDTVEHFPGDPRRGQRFGQPTHDVGVRVSGPIVEHIGSRFDDLWRAADGRGRGLPQSRSWLGGVRTRTIDLRVGVERPATSPPPRRKDVDGDAELTAGRPALQLLDTTPYDPRTAAHSFLAAYRNAVRNSKRFIYIEDQYFTPNLGLVGPLDEVDPSDSLLQDLVLAVQRGVSLLVAMPIPRKLFVGSLQANRRAIAVESLRRAQEVRLSRLSEDRTLPGNFLPFTVHHGGRSVYTHSKVLIVDDEFAIVGSGNVNSRSFRNDSETSLAVVDPTTVAGLRVALWAEHLQTTKASVADVELGIQVIRRATDIPHGPLQAYRGRGAKRRSFPKRLLDWLVVEGGSL
jgi:phosphatidylserine/phosphatidylglycerophosphate/cardiolipin synthase-like enzyme